MTQSKYDLDEGENSSSTQDHEVKSLILDYADYAEPESNIKRSQRFLEVGCAELLGTATLVFVACMGASQSVAGSAFSPMQAAFTSGLAVCIVIHTFAHISAAHVNPATTVCAYAMGAIELTVIPVYLVAQIAGSVLGFGLLLAVTPENHLYPRHILENGTVVRADHGVGMTLPPREEITIMQALLVEVLITLLLSYANCAAFDARCAKLNDSVAVRFGLIVAALNFIAVPYTGAGMNPARSFGPAFWYNDWHNHWIYWVGPMAASIIASVTYRLIFARKKHASYAVSSATATGAQSFEAA